MIIVTYIGSGYETSAVIQSHVRCTCAKMAALITILSTDDDMGEAHGSADTPPYRDTL